MKKGLALIMSIIIMIATSVQYTFAAESNSQNLKGYAYNLYTFDGQGNFDCTVYNETDEIRLVFSYDLQQYDITYTQNQEGVYESFFSVGNTPYYSVLNFNNDSFTGIVRDVSEIVSTQTNQFGFIIAPQQMLSEYTDALNIAKQSEQFSDAIQKNRNIAAGTGLTYVNPNARNALYVYVEAWGKLQFGEVWGDVTYASSGLYKTCTVTQYNVVQGIFGDGAQLRQFSSSGASRTLWSTPVPVPKGLQSVNQAYHIPYNYTGTLEVSVTGFYDIYGVPVPLGWIYADGVYF